MSQKNYYGLQDKWLDVCPPRKGPFALVSYNGVEYRVVIDDCKCPRPRIISDTSPLENQENQPRGFEHGTSLRRMIDLGGRLVGWRGPDGQRYNQVEPPKLENSTDDASGNDESLTLEGMTTAMKKFTPLEWAIMDVGTDANTLESAIRTTHGWIVTSQKDIHRERSSNDSNWKGHLDLLQRQRERKLGAIQDDLQNLWVAFNELDTKPGMRGTEHLAKMYWEARDTVRSVDSEAQRLPEFV